MKEEIPKTEPTIGETPTHPASESDLESLVSNSQEQSEGVKVCRSCLRPPDTNDTDYCGECGEKLVTIRKAKDPYIGTLVGDKYRVIKKIGQGGMGEVYLAENDTLRQKVAIKFLIKRFADDENIVLRFLNEARSYCRVTHPNAVTLLEFGQHDTGPLYIITEFVEGMSITETLKDSGLMSLEQTIDIGIQIAEVLSAAHEQGVIHRDLKPDNIMLTPSKRGRFVVKVLDFGIAKIIDDDEGPATETGSVFGTPEFMSPEQASGTPVDGRADIYAFGIILCFLLTGKLPFKGENKLAVLNQQLNSRPPRLSTLRPNMTFSRGMESIIMKCLEKKPEHRFQDAEEVLEVLESLRIEDGAFLTSLVSASGSVHSEIELEEFKMETVRLGGSKSSPTQLDSPFDDQHVNADLHSIEMWREAPTNPPVETGKNVSSVFWISLLVTVVVAVFASSYLLGGKEDSNDFDLVFNEGQALGVISVAEVLLKEGKISDVLAALQKARDWESSVETKAKISALSSETEQVSVLFSTFQKDPCTHDAELAEIGEISRGLAKRAKRLKKRKCRIPVRKMEKPEPVKGTEIESDKAKKDLDRKESEEKKKLIEKKSNEKKEEKVLEKPVEKSKEKVEGLPPRVL